MASHRRRCGNDPTVVLTAEEQDRTYPKCLFGETNEDNRPPRASHGGATDVRAWWPACTDYSPGAPTVSPDAARWTS